MGWWPATWREGRATHMWMILVSYLGVWKLQCAQKSFYVWSVIQSAPKEAKVIFMTRGVYSLQTDGLISPREYFLLGRKKHKWWGFLYNHRESFYHAPWKELDFMCSVVCARQNQRHAGHGVIYIQINISHWKHFRIYKPVMTLLSSQWVILAISVRLDGSVHQREISYLTCEQYKSFSWGFERKTYQKTEVKLLRHWGGPSIYSLGKVTCVRGQWRICRSWFSPSTTGLWGSDPGCQAGQ